ncbi:MAG: 1-deoxy-D-xylulose-5-phosphate reductoisomerase, partial [Clostridia bacterium]
MERRKVAVLGSTGSIGRQALEVIEAMPDRFQVVSLAAGRNVDLLARQVARTGARLVAAGDPASAAELRQRVGPGVQVVWGPEGLMQAALDAGADVVVVAVVGAAGLVPTV